MDKKIKIMPCLDMRNGRVVKGVHFVTSGTPGTRWNARGPTVRPARTNWPCWT